MLLRLPEGAPPPRLPRTPFVRSPLVDCRQGPKKKKRRPQPPKPAPRRIADISPHPETFPHSADASDRARSGSWPSARRKPSSSARRWRRRLGRRRRCSSSRTRRRRRWAGRSLPGRSLPPCGNRSSRISARGSPRSTRPSRRSSRRRRLRAATERRRRRRRRRQPRRRRRRRRRHSALSQR